MTDKLILGPRVFIPDGSHNQGTAQIGNDNVRWNRHDAELWSVTGRIPVRVRLDYEAPPLASGWYEIDATCFKPGERNRLEMEAVRVGPVTIGDLPSQWYDRQRQKAEDEVAAAAAELFGEPAKK